MRTLLRTTLITMLITLSALMLGLYMLHQSSTERAQAAGGLPVPSYCVEPALADIQEALTKTTNPSQLLLGKEKALEQAELDCAANATAHPPAKKPTELVGVLLPTSIPAPTATLQVGIQDGHPNPSNIFVPTDDNNNTWNGSVNGNIVQIVAGFMREQDENWRQDHPEWVTQGAQGALYVVVNYDGLKGAIYTTPSRHGVVHFVAACGSTLVLQATDNTIFTFDAATLTYVSNSTSCPIPTP